MFSKLKMLKSYLKPLKPRFIYIINFFLLQTTVVSLLQRNQCPSPLMLWVWILIRARCTTLCVKVCQWLATGQWFSPGYPVSSTNITDRNNIIEILLKVALFTIKQTNKQTLIRFTYINSISSIWEQLNFFPTIQ